MVQGKRFCTKCGTPLASGDVFCGSCGSPVSGTAPQPGTESKISGQATPPSPAAIPQKPVSVGEQITGVIPVSRKKGLLGIESFNIVVTEKRLIFALMTNDMLKQAAKENSGGGFLAGMIGAMSTGYTFYKRYLDMPPEAALKENPQNFAIDLSRVKKIKLELGKHQRDKTRGVDVYENSRLDIETIGDKYSFNVPNHFHNMAQDVIRKSGLL